MRVDVPLAHWLERPLLALDLGTASTVVAAAGAGVVAEPSLVARSAESGRPVAIGRDAEEMAGRTPRGLEVVRPLRGGAVALPELACELVQHVLAQLTPAPPRRPRLLLAVSDAMGEEERRTLAELAAEAGVKDCVFVEAIVAAAWGAGLPADRPVASMVVDIGAGKTEAAVVTLNGTAVSHAVGVGGDDIDDAIARYLEQSHGLRVGGQTAEDVKRELAALSAGDDERMLEVSGSDVETGFPKSVLVSPADVTGALEPPLEEMAAVVTRVLAETPPELAADILLGGITFTGGGAHLPGFAELVRERTGRPVVRAEAPELCVALGMLRSIGAAAAPDPRSESAPARTESARETSENGKRQLDLRSALERLRSLVAEVRALDLRVPGSDSPSLGPEAWSFTAGSGVHPDVSRLSALSERYRAEGRLSEAITCAHEALCRARRFGDRAGEAWALVALGLASSRAGALRKAEESWQQALPAAREAGDAVAEATALASLADLHRERDPEEALAYARAALATHADAPAVRGLESWVADLEPDVVRSPATPAETTEEITLH